MAAYSSEHEPGSEGLRKDGGQATSGNLGARELEDSCPPLICMGLETIENCNKDNGACEFSATTLHKVVRGIEN